MMHTPKGWLRRALLIGAPLLAAGALAAPAAAGVSGGGSTGQLIVNTVYNTVVKQDVTDVTSVQLSPLAQAQVAAGLAAPPPAPVPAGWLPPAGTLYTTSVSEHLDSTTTSHATSVSVSESPGAIVIGDPSCLACDLNGSTFVVQGTVTVTDTETTIETQHITRTTTITIDSFLATPQSKEQCKEGGWRIRTDEQGTPFRNQGACVSWVEHHNGTGNDDEHAGEHHPSDHHHDG